ncbi:MULTISPECIES: S1C family serine protease [Ureibacillus]|uniref:Serine protease Do n=1 Tax=Ureibacillus thermosphaericus TaxID=51173 RepID=A0A840PUK5_URETH|nr:trypsin-like peptidase domain-containing protein [Ureibacillus thermosphaericus]MBB5149597.1 serine protease Do [Ureibacillus thermosphaericus]NKZ31998.1 PDZ domain-containing protein [Ureibacillus thermosphaericus]
MSFYQNDDHRNESDKDFSYSPLQEQLRREEEEYKKRQNKKRQGVLGYFFSGFVGVIVGALLVWLLLPSMVDQLPSSTINTHHTPTITQTATEVTTDVTKAVEKVSKAVVGITNIQEVSDFWTRQSRETEAGSGSGVIYKVDGNKAYIVTNYHVVENAKQLEVTLADGTKENAELIGSDIWTDLAVVSIPSKNVEAVAEFGDSDVLKQGETVIAIGNPLGLDFYGSVTTGVISGKERSVPVDLNGDGYVDWETEVLQTDAAINPGNSGGALVNIAGELVGINSMKIAESTVEGLGFSIPINTVIPIIEELEQHGEVKRPTMGIGLLDLTDVPAFYQKQTLKLPEEVTTGVVVTEVVPGSPADRAGVEQYDVIVEMDGQKIENSIDLRQHLYNETEIGDTLKMKVYRAGKMIELQLKLTEGSQL